MWEYTEKVKDHFLNPRNAGTLDDASGVGEVGSLACGDALTLYIKVEDGIITDAKFQTFGCASAIASSSALTELVIGKTVEEAQKLTNKDIAEYLGGLPREKMHCSVMGQEALEQAIKNMRGEAPSKAEHSHEGELVCECFGVFDEEILRAIKENDLKTVEDVTNFTKAGGGCGKCIEDLERLLVQARGEGVCETPQEAPSFPAQGMTNLQRMHLIESVIDNDVRPPAPEGRRRHPPGGHRRHDRHGPAPGHVFRLPFQQGHARNPHRRQAQGKGRSRLTVREG